MRVQQPVAPLLAPDPHAFVLPVRHNQTSKTVRLLHPTLLPRTPSRVPLLLTKCSTHNALSQEVPPHELAERLATGQVALVLDVRSREDWEAEGHIAGAVCLPLDPELSQVGWRMGRGAWVGARYEDLRGEVRRGAVRWGKVGWVRRVDGVAGCMRTCGKAQGHVGRCAHGAHDSWHQAAGV